MDGLFFKNGEFDKERFAYIGLIKVPSGQSWHIAFLETIWGCSCRHTPRLLVFSSDAHYIGQYSHFNGRQFVVDGDAIIFNDIAPEEGNRIQFTEDGPPARVWIDGESPNFYK